MSCFFFNEVPQASNEHNSNKKKNGYNAHIISKVPPQQSFWDTLVCLVLNKFVELPLPEDLPFAVDIILANLKIK